MTIAHSDTKSVSQYCHCTVTNKARLSSVTGATDIWARVIRALYWFGGRLTGDIGDGALNAGICWPWSDRIWPESPPPTAERDPFRAKGFAQGTNGYPRICSSYARSKPSCACWPSVEPNKVLMVSWIPLPAVKCIVSFELMENLRFLCC